MTTVLIPCYNEQECLEDFIESLLNQTYTNLDIVFFDNASNDHTAEILLDYALQDKRIKHIRFDQHVSRNIQGYRTRHYPSQGEYLSFRSVNDLVHQEFFSSCMELLINDERIALAYSHGDLLNLSDNTRFKCPESTKIDTRNLSHLESAFHVMSRYTQPFSLWGVYRRDIFHKTQTFYHYGADHILVCEVALHGSIVPIERSLHTITIPGEEPSPGGIDRMWQTHHPLKDRGIGMVSPFMTLDIWIPFTSMIVGHQRMFSGADIEELYKPALQAAAINILTHRFSTLIKFEHDRLFSILRQSDLRSIHSMNTQFAVDLVQTMCHIKQLSPEHRHICHEFITQSQNW
jgi:hypothetical protein